jgi:hypothetical protein
MLVILVLAAAFTTLYLVGTGFVPTGADPGNWLAVAKEWLGANTMSANVAYPPVFPTLLAGLLLIAPPLVALVISACLTIVCFVGAIYVVARTLGRFFAFVAAVLVGTAGMQVEAYAWGGFPQLLATAFGLAALFFIVRHFDTRARSHLLIGLTLAGLTAGTHVMVGGLLVAGLPLATAYSVRMGASRGAKTYELKVALMIGVGVAMIVGASYLFGPGGTVATLNPAGVGRIDALTMGVEDAPLPWLLVAIGAIVVLYFRDWPPAVTATIAVGMSWAVASLGFFLITGEPRALMITQAGFLLSAVVGYATMVRYLGPVRRASHATQTRGGIGHRLLLIGGLSMFSAMVAGGLGAYAAAVDWYRVVGQEELAAIERLSTAARDGDLAISSIGYHGIPIGWWVEGYGGVPSYSGHDLRYLAFPDEREQAEVANTLFGAQLTVEESLEMLDETGADFLVVDRRGPDSGWLDSEFAQSLPVVDSGSQIAVLRVPD